MDLVRRVSITPHDAGCQELLAARLEACGFDCETLQFGPVTNLWARRGKASPLLCFAGHTDVVPPGNSAQWVSDPFEPVVRGAALYGRGTADMKAGLATMIVATERFVTANPAFDGSLAFLLTSDEEGDAVDGTAKVIETLGRRNETIDWCVIGEPSSRERLGDTIRIGRRGSLSGRLIVPGVQGHVAYPEKVDNPIHRFAPVLAELHQTRWDDGNEHFPPTSFQVVHLASSSGSMNVTPPELGVHFNFRYSTEWDHGSLRSAVTRILAKHGVETRVDWQLQGEPFLTGPGALIDAADRAITEICGSSPALSTAGGTSDGRYIAPAGAEVVEIGPVNASIHKVDEHVRLADLPRLARIYERVMELLLTCRT